LNVCRGAKVQISGKNFEPDWGLYNGAVGKVIETVFKENENLLDGTQPQYIVVDFPQYRDKGKTKMGTNTTNRNSMSKTLLQPKIYSIDSIMCKNWSYISRSICWP
jgi:hypothetical protein